MNKQRKKFELVINLAILIVSIVFVAVLIQKFYVSPSKKTPELKVGSQVNLPDTEWGNYEKSLILVMQKDCKYCTQSADFYKRITSITKEKNVQTIAVLPSELEESKKYLDSLGLSIQRIKKSKLDSINVKGTPTIILINDKGEIIQFWVGMLGEDKEKQVLESL
jgi:thioredoxin-related protein